MTARLFTNILPQELIQWIQTYQIPKKNTYFIERWMKRLTNKWFTLDHLSYWKFLVRDSENLVIQLPEQQYNGFNFAQFVESFIKSNARNGSVKYACNYFEIFCKNAIKNNPKLILNRYYVGNGGYPCFQMISTYLFRRSVNGTKMVPCQQIENTMYNLYIFFMQGDYLSSQHCYRFFCEFRDGPYITKYAVEALKVLFQKFEEFFLDADLSNNDYYNAKWMIKQLFEPMLEKFNRKLNCADIIRLIKNECIPQDEIEIESALRMGKIEEFLCWFQDKQAAILEKYKNWIVQQTFKHLTLKALQFVMALPGFRSLVFSKEYVFHLVESRKFKLFRLLWSVEEQRGTLCSFKSNGRNILETAAENRGLSHNFIDLLWVSKSFETLPNIKNQKSKAIIHQRYLINDLQQL